MPNWRKPTAHQNLVFILIFALGAASGGSYTYSFFSLQKTEVRKVSPLLDPALAYRNSGEYQLPLDFRLKESESLLRTRIQQEIEDNTIQEASIYYRSFNNGPWFGINEDARFLPGSLLKLPLAIALFKQSESDPNLLERQIAFNNPDLLPLYNLQFAEPAERLEIGRSYSVRTLIERSLIYSDNVAANLLERTLGVEAWARLSKDLYVPIDRNTAHSRGLTSKEYSTFFRVLYNSSYLSETNSEFLLNVLSKSTFIDGLRAIVPEGTIIAHKFGETLFGDKKKFAYLSDCGIIYGKTQPHIVCVMLRSDSRNKMNRELFMRLFRDLPIIY